MYDDVFPENDWIDCCDGLSLISCWNRTVRFVGGSEVGETRRLEKENICCRWLDVVSFRCSEGWWGLLFSMELFVCGSSVVIAGDGGVFLLTLLWWWLG